MKKYLILLVTLLTSLIFCVSNVSAYNSTVKNSTSDNWIYLNTYGMTKEEIQQYTNKYISYDSSKTSNVPDMILKCREYYETYYSEKYQYYIITSYLGNFTTEYYLLAFNEYPIYMVNYDINYIFNDTYRYNGLKILISENKSLDFVYFKTTNGTSFTNKKGFYMMYSGVVDTTDLNKLTNYYETNYSMDFYLNPYDNGSDIYSKFYYDDKIFSPGDIVFNTMVNNGINIIKPQEPTEPQLQYKTGFTSSEAYSVLGKVSVEFLETDTNIYKYKKSQFKLQFGSNDFSKENIPIFSHYKVYGKRNDTWTELSEEDLKMPYDQDINGNIIYDDRNLITVDTTYDYSEGMLADASITLEINYDYLVDLDTTNPIWTDWKIEFYFDNTNNGYIYVYDTLAESTWNDTAKIFNDYLFYYFPPGYRYAFISSEETSSIGRIYFPSNHYVSQLVRLKGFYYHYSINWIADELVRNISEEDTYYSYFDFNFSYSDKRCVALSRKLGSLYTGYYDPNFLSNYLKPFPDEWLIFNSEISYFYAPIGMKVTFSKEMLDDIIIYTPDGTIKNDSSTIYDTTDYDIWDDYDNVDDMFSHLTNFFQESIPYMKPLIDLFVDFYNSLNEYVKAFIEFLAIFLLICAVILWLDRRSDS